MTYYYYWRDDGEVNIDSGYAIVSCESSVGIVRNQQLRSRGGVCRPLLSNIIWMLNFNTTAWYIYIYRYRVMIHITPSTKGLSYTTALLYNRYQIMRAILVGKSLRVVMWWDSLPSHAGISFTKRRRVIIFFRLSTIFWPDIFGGDF